MWYPGSGVVYDCIDSCSLPSFLLHILGNTPDMMLCVRNDIILIQRIKFRILLLDRIYKLNFFSFHDTADHLICMFVQ